MDENENILNNQNNKNNEDQQIIGTNIEQISESTPIQAFASVNELQSLYMSLNYPNGLNSFATYTIPRDYKNQVKKAKELREYSIAKKLINIRKDYTLPIKQFKCKLKKQQKFYNEIVLPMVQRYARQWIVEKYSISECFAHYGFQSNKKTPMFLRLEDAENITPLSALGFEVYEIQLSPDLKSQIKKLQKQKAIDKLPEYLRDAINNDGYIKDKVILDYSSMYRTAEDKQDYEYRVKPQILGVAKQLILREFLIDLDYIMGFSSQKNNITHVKCGKDDKPIVDEKILQAIHNLITNRPPGSAIITTRGDISIQGIDFKLSELFDSKRFEQSSADILDHFGLPTVFVPSKSEGINNTTVLISLKPFEQSIKTDRKIFQEFLNIFCKEINKRNGYIEIPTVEYEHTNIRETGELIKELQFLTDRGVLSFEDVCLEFDMDLDEVMEKKKYDWENRDIQAPVIELSQGTSPLLTKKFEQEKELKKSTTKPISSKISQPNQTGQPKTKPKTSAGDNSE